VSLTYLLSTTDAHAWAEAFMRVFNDEDVLLDKGLMLTWFAGAIETGREAGRRSMSEHQ
jgi:hypothetical protein